MFTNNLIAGAAGQSTGFYDFPLEQSLRFNDDDSAYLTFDPAADGDRDNWSLSFWFKRANLGLTQLLFGQGTSGSNNRDIVYIAADDTLEVASYGGSYVFRYITTQKFRDPSAWYHLVISYQSGDATASDRLRIYLNGERVTAFSTSTDPSQNTDSAHFNSGSPQYIGRYIDQSGSYLDGYMAEVNFIDGTAYDASSFGELKNGVWIPKDPSGLTYGTNGFRLSFADDAEVEAFNTVLWRGDGTDNRSITGMGFQPDLVWWKERSSTSGHYVSDAVRGATKQLIPNGTNAELSNTDELQAFESDGFQIGTQTSINQSGETYVAWGWKAGDSNVSNTDGSITSTVRANDTYGFSIVSYTGDTDASKTIGHGLGAVPSMIIVKGRNVAQNWVVYHSSNTGSPETQRLYLDGTNATDTVAWWNNTAPTSSVFSVSNFGGTGGAYNYIAYCWAEKAGYSKFSSYTGSGTAPSSLISTGFKPAFVLIKEADGVDGWGIYDGTRNTSKPRSYLLQAQDSGAESSATANYVDFESTGFKVCTGGSNGNFLNESGKTYIYAAFADTREAAFWLDQSGNNNDWQPVNLDHNDTVADSPTDNFATWNPLNKGSAITLKDGNLSFTQTSTWNGVTGTVGVSSGQWYFEYTYGGGTGGVVGVAKPTYDPSTEPGVADTVWRYRADDGTKRNGGGSSSAYGATWTNGDVIGVAYDLDVGEIEFYKNGTSQGVAFTNLAGETVVPVAGTYNSTNASYVNFGQQPFKYDPPA